MKDNDKDCNKFNENLKDSINNEKVYGKFILTEEFGLKSNMEKGGYQVQISLLNDYMLDVDRNFLKNIDSGKLSIKQYHPYFFEFFAYTNDQLLEKYISKFAGKWLIMKLLDDIDSVSKDEYIVIKGDIIFSASPLERRSKYIVFSKNINDTVATEINSCFTPEILADITSDAIGNKNIITRFIEEIQPIDYVSGFVYNVGQGNFISLNINDYKILFDVGITYNKDDLEDCYIQNNKDGFSLLKPNAIVLSHWDIDHILAVGYLDSSIIYDKDFIWLAPDLSLVPSNTISHSAYRLCLYLFKKTKLCLIKQTGSLVCNSQDGKFQLWQGKGKSDHSTVANNSGLIIKLQELHFETYYRPFHVRRKQFSWYNKILLSGDCEYDQMPSEIVNDRYDLLVVPHHGSNLIMPNIIAEFNEGQCIISVGNNTHGHPGGNHMMDLTKNGFKDILLTSGRPYIKF